MRIRDDEMLQQARATQGLERRDQIRCAVPERNGTVSLIPKR